MSENSVAPVVFKYPAGLSEGVVMASVEAKVSLLPDLVKKIDPLLKRVEQVCGETSAPVWERRAHVDDVISEVTKLVAPLSCCSKGCGNCCKMAVTITNREAEAIAKAYGITAHKAKPATEPKP